MIFSNGVMLTNLQGGKNHPAWTIVSIFIRHVTYVIIRQITLWLCQNSYQLLEMAIEIVDLPIDSMVISHGYVSLPGGMGKMIQGWWHTCLLMDKNWIQDGAPSYDCWFITPSKCHCKYHTLVL